MDRIYLDNAATSWPKPPAVYDAMDRYVRDNGAPAGRGVSKQALHVAQSVARVRRSMAKLIGAGDDRSIVLTSNGTDALNLAIHGTLTDSGHVVTTEAEHNSVLRPLRALQQTSGVQVTRVPCDASGRVQAADVLNATGDDTQLVVVTHASNVTGALQPVADIGRALNGRDIMFLVDAAQSLGQVPLDVTELHADMLAAPGHKGLLGPLGTGILYVGPRAEQQLVATRQGGTGSESESEQQPQQLPERLEVGNLNVPGILGLGAGVEYLLEHGVAAIRDHHLRLLGRLTDGIAGIDGVTIHGADPSVKVGVLSVSVAGYDPQEVAAILDNGYGIQVRAGFHCAAAIHARLATDASGGTVRFSIGPFNTAAEIDQAIIAIGEIAASALPT